MERNTKGFSSTSSDRHRKSAKASNRTDRFARCDPSSQRVNPALRAAEFDQFARSVHRDLNPRGPLENLITRQAIRSAWRLKSNLDAESDPVHELASNPATDRAARALEVAISTLDLLQGRPEAPAMPIIDDQGSSSFELDFDVAVFEPNEWPVVPVDLADDLIYTTETAEEAPIWHGRLVYDFDVSEQSPVIKGTWITVSHVVSLIVDGATWAEILRTHPELTEDDVRVCVAYAVAEDDSAL